MRSVLAILAVIVAGVFLGGMSAWYTIQRPQGLGAINIGPWSAFPYVGANTIDPYRIAKVVADGAIPLGAAEGLAFEAQTDSAGDVLQLNCDYRVEGTVPASRLWTLVAYDVDGRQVTPAPGARSARYSGALLRYGDGSFQISISRQPKPGNWLGLRGRGQFRLVMRLYDTPVAGSLGLEAPVMPRIVRGDCRP